MFAWLALALANPGGEIAIVLDNSTSMIDGGTLGDIRYGAQDPDRIAVLGALVVEGLVRDSRDRLVVYAFQQPPDPALTATEPQAIRNAEYVPATPFRPALTAVRDQFTTSALERKVLVLLTDGMPDDVRTEAEAHALLLPHTDRIGIGFFRDARVRAAAESKLGWFVDDPSDLHSIDPAKPDVVLRTLEAFTTSYARVLGSRPEVGSVAPGRSQRFTAGRYVTEVLVAVASRDPGPLGGVTLTGPGGPIAPRAAGDNGCEFTFIPVAAPRVCSPPRRHYQAYRAPHDPDQPGTWELTVPADGAHVEYGVVLHYDLVAAVSAPARARVGEPVTLSANLTSRGQIADDPELFATPGFVVTARIGDDTVSLAPAGGGRFTGTWTPGQAGVQPIEVAFTGGWLDQRARTEITIADFVPLTLDIPPVDAGSWSGARSATRQCAALDLSASTGADRVPIRCAPAPIDGATVTCEPDPSSAPTLSDGSTGEPLRWTVCVEAEGCCGALPTGAAATLAVQGDHAHYDAGAVVVPVRFEVGATGLLRCWWVELGAIAGALFAAWFAAGWLRPHGFDPALSVRMASKEPALKRATALVLAEAPGGRRGFYRNARFAVMADGAPTRKAGRALLVVEAGPRGRVRFTRGQGLEKQDRRSRNWVPVELGADVETGALYRVGSMILKFG